jgi:hypothetical protein
MSNQLKMADIQAILSLRAQGRSFREIARQLVMFVRRQLRQNRPARFPAPRRRSIQNRPAPGHRPANARLGAS